MVARGLHSDPLNAAYFHLYGIECCDVDYTMETFPIVKRKEEAAHSECRPKRVILEMYDVMQQAMDMGDIHFYELAYLEVKIAPSRRKHSMRVELTDFVIPNDELIPPEVRQKIRQWSDYVDYWAVDWDFRNDTFINRWTSYRTRRDRSLRLQTDPHTYDEPGTYNVLVKVIDIFGNDTSQVFTVEVT